jgi:hypothetical protein
MAVVHHDFKMGEKVHLKGWGAAEFTILTVWERTVEVHGKGPNAYEVGPTECCALHGVVHHSQLIRINDK